MAQIQTKVLFTLRLIEESTKRSRVFTCQPNKIVNIPDELFDDNLSIIKKLEVAGNLVVVETGGSSVILELAKKLDEDTGVADTDYQEVLEGLLTE